MLRTEHLIQILEAAGVDHNVVYVSVPITSGVREVALLKELDLTSARALRTRHRQRWLHEVVGLNEREARELTASVRAASWGRDTVVVDPSQMQVEGWDQDDYNGFWIELMARHVRVLVATPGWATSRGARGEVGYAVSLGLEVVDIKGLALDAGDLQADAEAARQNLLDAGWPPGDVDEYLPRLEVKQRPALRSSAQLEVFEWLANERRRQVSLFGAERDDANTRADGIEPGGWWDGRLERYRAGALSAGAQTEEGRAELAKYVATACALLESVVRVHGGLREQPEPDEGAG